MGDWIGLLFFALLAAAVVFGLRQLSKPRISTSDEFERNAAEATMLGGSMNALQEALDPASARAKEVVMQMKDGRYQKKKREGKAGADADPSRAAEENGEER